MLGGIISLAVTHGAMRAKSMGDASHSAREPKPEVEYITVDPAPTCGSEDDAKRCDSTDGGCPTATSKSSSPGWFDNKPGMLAGARCL